MLRALPPVPGPLNVRRLQRSINLNVPFTRSSGPLAVADMTVSLLEADAGSNSHDAASHVPPHKNIAPCTCIDIQPCVRTLFYLQAEGAVKHCLNGRDVLVQRARLGLSKVECISGLRDL